MDEWTLNHFENWLSREVRTAEARDAVRAAMLAEYASDPAWYNAEGWFRLYDAVNGFAIEQTIENTITANPLFNQVN